MGSVVARRFASMKDIGTWDHRVRKCLPLLTCDTVLKYSFHRLFVSWMGSLDPPDIELMTLTMPPVVLCLGDSFACSGTCPGSSFGVGGRVASS